MKFSDLRLPGAAARHEAGFVVARKSYSDAQILWLAQQYRQATAYPTTGGFIMYLEGQLPKDVPDDLLARAGLAGGHVAGLAEQITVLEAAWSPSLETEAEIVELRETLEAVLS